MKKAEFIAARNAQLQHELDPCECGYEPPDYMSLIDHREKVHGNPRGPADDFVITKGDPEWKDPRHTKILKLVKAAKGKGIKWDLNEG